MLNGRAGNRGGDFEYPDLIFGQPRLSQGKGEEWAERFRSDDQESQEFRDRFAAAFRVFHEEALLRRSQAEEARLHNERQ